MFRFVFLLVLVILFVVPLYRLLKRRAIRIKSELEQEDLDLRDRLEELNQKGDKLLEDCNEALQKTKDRAAEVKEVKKNLEGGK